jgi:hypothetical protein
MLTWYILLGVILVLLLAPFIGLFLLRRFLAGDSPDDAEFDNPAVPQQASWAWPAMIWNQIQQLLHLGPRQLTYRRDRRGRFRKVRRP